MQAIYKIIEHELNNYKLSVKRDVESEDGYNLYQLEKRLGILKQEKIYLSFEEERVFKELHRTYLNGGDLLAQVNNKELYSSIYKDLVENNVFKETKVNKPFVHIEYQINDKKEFTKLARATIRQFLCVVYWLERKNFILNYASKIERENRILSDSIISTIEKLRHKKPIRRESIKNKSSNQKSQPKLTKDPRYISFYSSKLRDLRIRDINDLLAKMNELSRLAIKSGILSDKTDEKLLLDFFTTERLARNRKIIWKGTAFELKEFTKLIANTGICEEIKPRSSEKWKVVQSCFHIKLKGKPIGPIDDLESISGAKSTKSDRLEHIKTLVDKIKEAANE